jgi:DNA-binding response OmpR family regulator
VHPVSQSNGAEEIIEAGELILRPAHYMVSLRGRVLLFSRREFDVLLAMIRQQGRIITRDDLYAAVWGGRFEKSDRSVDVYVHKVRAKLAREAPDWLYIHTHFGFGYRFQPERSQVFHNTATAR